MGANTWRHGPSLEAMHNHVLRFISAAARPAVGICVCERSDLVAARAIIEGGTGKYQAETSDTSQVNAELGLLECQEDLAKL